MIVDESAARAAHDHFRHPPRTPMTRDRVKASMLHVGCTSQVATSNDYQAPFLFYEWTYSPIPLRTFKVQPLKLEW